MQTIEVVEKRLSEICVQYRWPALIISMILILASVAGLGKFQVDADPRVFFSESNEHLQRFVRLEEEYGRFDTITFALHIKEGTLYNKKNLTILKELTNEAWQIPYAARVDSLANYAYSWSEGDDLYVEELIEDVEALDTEKIARIKHIAHTDPDIVNRLTSTQGELAIVNIIANIPHIDRVAEEKEAALAGYALAEKLEAKYPHIDIAATGYLVSNTATIGKGMEDASTLIPAMYLIIFVLLGFFLRSVSAVFIVFVITLSSTLAALGLGFHFGIVLNMMSMAAMNIIITVSIAHCVHLLNYFLSAYQSGTDKITAMRESIRINLQPIFLTSFTTALGFLSMNFSNMPPAHDLGNISASGVFIAFVLSLTVLPALAIALPFKRTTKRSSKNFQQRMIQLGNFVIRRRQPLLALGLIFSLAMLSQLPKNVINDVFAENIKKPSQFREDNEKIDRYFGGLFSIEYDFDAPPGSSISDPEYLLALEKYTAWLREQPRVKYVRSYSDIIKRLNMNMHGDDPTFYKIPENQQEAAQYLLLFELSQPMGSDITHLIKSDKSASKLSVTMESMDSLAFKKIGEGYNLWIQNNMPDYMQARSGSISFMWAYLGSTSSKSAILGALYALLIISLILTLVFKSLRYGLISLIPNLLPAGIGYGLWAIHSGILQMSQMMVLSITIGIVVDDTVHFLSKYIRARRENNATSQEAVLYAFKHVGAPLWITTVVLVAGFGLLITSSFVPNAELGTLTAMILIAALALDFFMLPPLLMLLDGTERPYPELGNQAENEPLNNDAAALADK